MKFLHVKNWDQFQQYKDRDPKWIKLHRDVLDNYEFDALNEIQQVHLLKIWLLAAKLDNRIPYDAEWVARKIGAQSKVDLKQLVASGFLCLYESVRECTEVYTEREEEGEREEEKEGEREGAPNGARATRLPPDFPAETELHWAQANEPTVDARREAAKFCDHWRGKSGKDGAKKDWPATWRNWIRRAAEYQRRDAPDSARLSVIEQAKRMRAAR